MFTGFFSDSVTFVPILLEGVWMTIAITISALVIASLLGLFWAMLRVSGISWLANGARIVTNLIRGIPIIVLLFYVYFVLPEMGIQMSAFQAGAFGLGIAYSAYMAEVFRSGIEAIDVGQIEAANSLGMSRILMMRRVILPQAFKIALPPYSNNMVMLLKDSSQASVITVVELSMQAKLVASSSFKNATVFTLVALLYLCLSLPLMALAGWLERKYNKAKK
ncbi:amino acid ABC transporter permease [Glaciimonas sp. PCH181]|uniref:amino acid ABC transporter permease n=1 Tax=Glaciimonas sp. PCH181 TaxID=2133943 RepID=UPI000D3A297B|nr:amino acid ABC transporter permease [Glaciimonas sp. PCH181]PUA16940.1 amino acid ABC transporter permease [Glaciimonas sp. PCH181]